MKVQVYFLLLILTNIFTILLAHSIPSTNSDDKNDADIDRYHPVRKFNVKTTPRKIEDKESWSKDAQSRLQEKLDERKKRIDLEAKNTIMFLGDGMSLSTVTAARIFKGQEQNSEYGGEETVLHFDTFPHTALSKTYCVDSQVADSACSATAYLCGVKANIATIGVNSDVMLRDCVAQMDPKNQVSSLLSWAQAAGKSTGIVTTTRVTHASPAGAYAHIAARDWESDYQISMDEIDPSKCDDIALQLIAREPGKNINVILGGGRSYFFNVSESDVENGNGTRRDGRHLINEWIEDKKDKKGKYVDSREELLKLDGRNIDYLLGLFATSHLAYQIDEDRQDDPSLSEMTKIAIEILRRNPKGFFLFVEGGKIDHAHHDNEGKRALGETVEFDNSIKIADDLTSDDDTLIVVTSDHSHVMTINGYPHRGNPLLGVAGQDDNTPSKPYATLSYANGPGQRPFHNEAGECVVRNITDDEFERVDYRQLGMVHLGSETHGGDDVIIFAKGPFSYLFSGVQQQSFIPHVMAYSSCLGNGAKFCDERTSDNGAGVRDNINIIGIFVFLVFILIQ